jgi:hypothetical protein
MDLPGRNISVTFAAIERRDVANVWLNVYEATNKAQIAPEQFLPGPWEWSGSVISNAFFPRRVVLTEAPGKYCEDESASDHDIGGTDFTFHHLYSIKYPSVESMAKDTYSIVMNALDRFEIMWLITITLRFR